MASPIAQLREGIEAGQWGTVCRAYSRLTGEEVEAPDGQNDAYGAALLAVAEIVEGALSPARGGRDKGPPAFVVDQNAGETADLVGPDTGPPTPPEKRKRGRPRKKPAGPPPELDEDGDPDKLAAESRALSEKVKGRRRETRAPYRPLEVYCDGCREPQEGVRPGELNEGVYTCDRCVSRRRNG